MAVRFHGVPLQQIVEVEDTFNQYDVDKNGWIDKKELKQCLFSLGEEKDSNDIDVIISQHGDVTMGAIDLKHFTEFLIHLYGDTGSKNEVLGAFDLIAKGNIYVDPENILRVLEPQDLDFFMTTAPLLDDGYDFRTWTEEAFAR